MVIYICTIENINHIKQKKISITQTDMGGG
jgi:hypothetical protein